MNQVDAGDLSFIEKYKLGLITDFENNLDSEVDLWYLGKGSENLYEFLGLNSLELVTNFLIGDLEDFLKRCVW